MAQQMHFQDAVRAEAGTAAVALEVSPLHVHDLYVLLQLDLKRMGRQPQ